MPFQSLARQTAALCLLALPVVAQETLVVTTVADSGEGSLRAALEQASGQEAPATIVIFAEGDIAIEDTLTYSGQAPLSLFGNATRITAQRDVTLLSLTGGADLYMRNIRLEGPGGWDLENRSAGPAGKGLFVALRAEQTGSLSVELENVQVTGTAGHGIHVTDCLRVEDCGADAGGQDGSAASILLRLNGAEVLGAGRGALGADGLRVEERGDGGITLLLNNVRFAENGGNGIALDEGQGGDVVLRSSGSAFETNGGYCDPDRLAPFLPDPPEGSFDPGAMARDAIPGAVGGSPEDACFERRVALHGDGSVADYAFALKAGDGVEIHEAGPGAIHALIERAGVIGNFGAGLDFAETGGGDIRSTLIGTFARQCGRRLWAPRNGTGRGDRRFGGRGGGGQWRPGVCLRGRGGGRSDRDGLPAAQPVQQRRGAGGGSAAAGGRNRGRHAWPEPDQRRRRGGRCRGDAGRVTPGRAGFGLAGALSPQASMTSGFSRASTMAASNSAPSAPSMTR
ncbi:hypothetical protein [Ponticoccus sp. (in: a-proteobacteria)]|uniref:hypothetical protein n=1 Tax=Ponticoccus sp. (in: a-proteobacteria) TaxID=1925025 RepID=UPI003AB561AB